MNHSNRVIAHNRLKLCDLFSALCVSIREREANAHFPTSTSCVPFSLPLTFNDTHGNLYEGCCTLNIFTLFRPLKQATNYHPKEDDNAKNSIAMHFRFVGGFVQCSTFLDIHELFFFCFLSRKFVRSPQTTV